MERQTGVTGVLLAAGAGRRMGRPKATITGTDGVPWVVTATRALLRGGCNDVVIVLGAGADRARELLDDTPLDAVPATPPATPPDDIPLGGVPAAEPESAVARRTMTVYAPGWADGIGESLRTGLLAARDRGATAACVHLVDLPDVGSQIVARVTAGARTGRLARAVYNGKPGHPVLIGADHFDPLIATLSGDVGAKGYLAARGVGCIECSDLARGADVDHWRKGLG